MLALRVALASCGVLAMGFLMAWVVSCPPTSRQLERSAQRKTGRLTGWEAIQKIVEVGHAAGAASAGPHPDRTFPDIGSIAKEILCPSRPIPCISEREIQANACQESLFLLGDYHLAPACPVAACSVLRLIRAAKGDACVIELAVEALPTGSEVGPGATRSEIDRALGLIGENWPFPIHGFPALLDCASALRIRTVGLGERLPAGLAARRRSDGTYGIPLRAADLAGAMRRMNDRVFQFSRGARRERVRIVFSGAGHFLHPFGLSVEQLAELPGRSLFVMYDPELALPVLSREPSLHDSWLNPVNSVYIYPVLSYLAMPESIVASAVPSRVPAWEGLPEPLSGSVTDIVRALEKALAAPAGFDGWGDDLIPFLRHSEPKVQRLACALAGLESRPSRALQEALCALLGSGDGDVRAASAQTLGGPAAWVPHVRACLSAALTRATEPWEAAWIVGALSVTASEPGSVPGHIRRLLESASTDQELSQHLRWALGRYSCTK